MSDNNLSEDEMNALLTPRNNELSPMLDDYLRLSRRMTPIFNKTLSRLVGKKCLIKEPKATLPMPSAFPGGFSDDLIEVEMHIYGENNGTRHFYIDKTEALQIVNPMMGIEVEEYDEAALSAISDAFLQIANAESDYLKQEFHEEISVGEPEARQIDKGSLSLDSSIFALQYDVYFDDEKTLTVIEVMNQDLAEGLGSLLHQEDKSESAKDAGAGKTSHPTVEGVNFPNFRATELGPREEQNLGLLMDVPVTLSVELGRTKWQLRDVLTIGEGSIIVLDKQAGEPVDVLVNNNLIARGEVVVVDENFSVRITEIISTFEQMVQKGL